MDGAQPMITVDQMYGKDPVPYEEVQAALDRSLSPRSSEWLYDTVASLGIGSGHLVVDVGARDARHGLELAARLGCRVVGVDPVVSNVEDGQALIAGHAAGDLVELQRGVIENLPIADGSADLVFSRDMLTHIADVGRALAECRRVLKSGGAMVVYQTFAGPRMEPREASELYAALATVAERMDPVGFEAAARTCGFTIESREIVGSQWREAWEEDGSRLTSRQLLHAARLLRAPDEFVAEFGDITYRVELGNALWGVYQMIGKLEPRIYVLRRTG